MSPQTIHNKLNNHIFWIVKYVCSGFKKIWQNAFPILAIETILFAWKPKITESNGSFNKGPGCKQSFNEGPLIFELVSNTIRTLDVTRSSLITSLCGVSI